MKNSSSDSPDAHQLDADEYDALVNKKALPQVLPGPITRLQDRLSGACLFIASISLVVLVAIFGWLVFGRYVLNDTPTWVEQLSLLLVIVITFLGSAALVHEDRHLGVTFIRDALPLRLRIVARMAGDVSVAAFGTAMAIYCSELVAFSWGNTLPMLGLPEGVRSLPAALCGGLIALFAGLRTINGMITLVGGHAEQESN